MIPEAAVEALARVLANEALFDADIGGYGWDAETDSSDHFMPTARKLATEYLEAAAPHMLAELRSHVSDQILAANNTEGFTGLSAGLVAALKNLADRIPE